MATALIGGLAENSQESQTGIVLQYHDNTSHGYRYEFRKDSITKSYHADSLDGSLYSMLHVRLEIAPVANGLHPSSTQSPIDLGELSTVTQNAIKAVAFRGLMPTNSRLEFRPTESVTRRDFAIACVRSLHLHAPSKSQTVIADLKGDGDVELQKALDVGFVTLDEENKFHPEAPISDRDLEAGLRLLAKRSVTKPSSAFIASLESLEQSEQRSISRSHLAVLLTQLLFPHWLDP